MCSALSVATVAAGESRPHVHGAAELTLAQEGHSLEIMLISPAMSILGFESQAKNEVELQAITDAQTALANGTELFSFSGTQCQLLSADVDLSAVLAVEHVSNFTHAEHEEEHHENHDENEGHEASSSHSDISAHYSFSCKDKERLTAVRFGALSLPFGLQSVAVSWVTDRKQGAATLTAAAQIVELR